MANTIDGVTNHKIEIRLKALNKLFGYADTIYKPERDDKGNLVTNAGHYYLSQEYAGVCVQQACEGGGAHDVFGSGHESKRDCYNRLCAFLQGVRYQREFDRVAKLKDLGFEVAK